MSTVAPRVQCQPLELSMGGTPLSLWAVGHIPSPRVCSCGCPWHGPSRFSIGGVRESLEYFQSDCPAPRGKPNRTPGLTHRCHDAGADCEEFIRSSLYLRRCTEREIFGEYAHRTQGRLQVQIKVRPCPPAEFLCLGPELGFPTFCGVDQALNKTSVGGGPLLSFAFRTSEGELLGGQRQSLSRGTQLSTTVSSSLLTALEIKARAVVNMLPHPGTNLLGSLLVLLISGQMRAATCFAFRHCVGLYFRSFGHPVKHQGVSSNVIEVLPTRGLENLTSLEHLRLDRNNLNRIEPRAFWSLHSLLVLNLSYNQLTSLEPGAFQSLSNLTTLILRCNKLGRLSRDAVLPLSGLRDLDISFNKFSNVSAVFAALAQVPALEVLDLQNSSIRYLDISSHYPPQLSRLLLASNPISILRAPAGFFGNIQYLDLSHGSLSRIKNFTSINFTRLRHLNIKNNPMNRTVVMETVQRLRAPLSSITLSYLKLGRKETLRELCGILQRRRVRSVSFEGNGLRDVSGAFDQCRSVSTLDLSHNKMKKSDMFTCSGSPGNLQRLILDHNSVQNISLFSSGQGGKPCNRTARGLDNLLYLSFRYNRISAIRAHAFEHVPNLKNLSLALNDIVFIDTSAFVGLTRLKFLSLANNAISEVFNITFSHIKNLEHLKLRNNRIPIVYKAGYSILSKLVTLDLGGNHIEKMEAEGFKGLRSLINLYLDRNWISTLSAEMFQDLQSLQVLDLANNKLTFQAVDTQPFHMLPNLRMLKLQSQTSFGPITLSHNLFHGLGQLKELEISDNKFTTLHTLPFHPLGALEVLLMNNIYHGFQTMHNQTFANLASLRVLMLNNVGLESIRRVLFENLTSLTTLTLKRNLIHVVREDDVPQLRELSSLDLQENPISCVCDNLWFQQWAVRTRIQVPFFYKFPCVGPGEKKSQLLVQFDSLVCDSGFVAFCISAPVLFIVMLTALLYEKQKWGFHYGYYLLRAWIRQKQLSKSNASSHQYDAFVSYNSKDESWVFDQLMQHLETEGPQFCHLCLHHRDFAVGKPIVENIVDAIYNSKKTLCVISKNYLQSEWCSMEMQVALYRLFEEHSDVLILVFLDEIPGHVLSSYHHLRKLVKRKTYIHWPADDAGQRLFWAKLRDALREDRSPSEQKAHPLIQHPGLLY
ncbi:toll-like receptor 13 [Narcine bancroftii]|uniref:toll-like receptor 13 n=1 Tax=Narcine bancroftii TaxID=1343680 RepID=UPI003831BD75